ncbi:hypothetical protein BLNAU_6813 [Blattamonas nauphoetae]|uniref:Uncharacterized protein n=1 Tax=Blattamonas nauphoetae TaxID=2049346 RepID=A0ABQ9Y303_9EUKA|nr:hypothetical protein BLNAU_6813 [Blattamonas nauphoetae]
MLNKHTKANISPKSIKGWTAPSVDFLANSLLFLFSAPHLEKISDFLDDFHTVQTQSTFDLQSFLSIVLGPTPDALLYSLKTEATLTESFCSVVIGEGEQRAKHVYASIALNLKDTKVIDTESFILLSFIVNSDIQFFGHMRLWK